VPPIRSIPDIDVMLLTVSFVGPEAFRARRPEISGERLRLRGATDSIVSADFRGGRDGRVELPSKTA